MSKFKIYLISISIPLILGGIVGFIISGYIDYNSLVQPAFSPPSILFPIAWTILYFLMGLSYGTIIIYSNLDSNVKTIYYTQLIINLFWPIIFFVMKNRLLALIWIVLLLILVIIMVMRFFSKNKTASLLQIPYLLWTAYATYLNLFIYLLNNKKNAYYLKIIGILWRKR